VCAWDKTLPFFFFFFTFPFFLSLIYLDISHTERDITHKTREQTDKRTDKQRQEQNSVLAYSKKTEILNLHGNTREDMDVRIDCRDKGLLLLIDGLFWIFLAITIAYIIYIVIIPTPTEWGIVTGELQRTSTGFYVARLNASSFPNDFTLDNFIKAVVRHWSFMDAHINSTFMITTISFAFLTMFIRNIGRTMRQLFNKGETVPISTYIEWAIGSLISGILFFSSNINAYNLTQASISIGVIVVFAVTSYFILYELRKKLKTDEKAEHS
jgi:hypothetical protein